MSKPITKIDIVGFRGATGTCELDFDPDKDITMLFGENGSGKSTILDAIDVVCNGTVGCLDGISVGQSPGQYLCALGSRPTALQVTVWSNAESWIGTMRRNAISVAGHTERPRVRILRRNRILDLVVAQPSDRYKALQHFIDIAVIEQSESALQQQLTATSRSIDTLTADKLRMSGQLDALWQAEGRPEPGPTAMTWAQSKVTLGIAGLGERHQRLSAVVNAVSGAVTACSEYRTRRSTQQPLVQELETVDAEIAAAPAVAPATAVMLLESLEKARDYIEAERTLDKCPTCLRPIARNELLDTVTNESGQLSALKILADRKVTVRRQLDVAESHLAEALGNLQSKLRTLHEATALGDVPEIANLNIVWPAWGTEDLTAEALLAIGDLIEPVQANLVQQRDSVNRDVSQFNSIREWWAGISETTQKLSELDRIRGGLQRAFEIVHQKRINFTQSILDDIRQEANRLFQVIHPGENIGLEHLKMEEARRGSVSQTGIFHGHTDIPPQAVFSESHLDTLGFSVWLALAKREEPQNTILLIDDIFSSVDSSHLSRVIDLLAAEAPNFLQLIVATHYRLWWDRCQLGHGIQRVHLGRWCVTNGIAAQNMPLVTQQLRLLIANPILDRQAVSSKAGILLESILDDLALLYECSLPRNKMNLYTLGALLNGCSKLFSRHNLTVNINTNWNADGQPELWQPTAARAAYDRVNGMQFIRNQVGCHFNPPGTEIPDNDVREFGTATISLIEALTCPNCGALPTRTAPDGTHLRCTCANRAARMTPVTIP